MGRDQKPDKPVKPVNVEFGHEFGDVNSAKIYEIPFMNKKDGKKKTNKK